jgi:hypothetical protein
MKKVAASSKRGTVRGRIISNDIVIGYAPYLMYFLRNRTTAAWNEDGRIPLEMDGATYITPPNFGKKI